MEKAKATTVLTFDKKFQIGLKRAQIMVKVAISKLQDLDHFLFYKDGWEYTNQLVFKHFGFFPLEEKGLKQLLAHNLSKILDLLPSLKVSKDNSFCEDNTFAYVSADGPPKVSVCKLARDSELTGKDSLPGTLIHETSHFTNVIATKDYAYGEKDAFMLAKKSIRLAMANADNYQYFVEGLYEISFKQFGGGKKYKDFDSDACVIC